MPSGYARRAFYVAGRTERLNGWNTASDTSRLTSGALSAMSTPLPEPKYCVNCASELRNEGETRACSHFSKTSRNHVICCIVTEKAVPFCLKTGWKRVFRIHFWPTTCRNTVFCPFWKLVLTRPSSNTPRPFAAMTDGWMSGRLYFQLSTKNSQLKSPLATKETTTKRLQDLRREDRD
jgi:hypothetical protein